MKRRESAVTRILTLLLVGFTVLSITAVAAGTAGSSADPLITLSYLNDTFLPELLGKADEKLAARKTELSKELSAQVESDKKELEKKYGAQGTDDTPSGTAASFAVVTLPAGQTLYGEIGCEVLLRVGTATVVSPSSPGLIDSTGGTTLDSGSLVKNHLYLMTIEGRGVKAGASAVKLLVRGAYTVK